MRRARALLRSGERFAARGDIERATARFEEAATEIVNGDAELEAAIALAPRDEPLAAAFLVRALERGPALVLEAELHVRLARLRERPEVARAIARAHASFEEATS